MSDIDDALELAATRGVKRVSESDKQVDFLTPAELLEVQRREAGKTATGKPGFGLRFSKLIPPGTG